MIKHVYKIKFYKSTFELNVDYERLSDYEKDAISELNADSFFDYEDELDNYVCYIIVTPVELDRYLKILKNNLIENECSDLSKPILKSEIDLDELEDKLDSSNYFKFDFFMDDLNSWIYDNLEIDIVLDRITEVGMNSLKDIEKDFLKNYNNEQD
jgi:hypothetical protein